MEINTIANNTLSWSAMVPAERYDTACAERDRLRRELRSLDELAVQRFGIIHQHERTITELRAKLATTHDCLKQAIDGCTQTGSIKPGARRTHLFLLGTRSDLKIDVGSIDSMNTVRVRVDRDAPTPESRARDAVRNAGILGSKVAIDAITKAGLKIVAS